MLFENELIRWLVGIVGLWCIFGGVAFSFSVLLMALVTARLPRLERMLEREKDANMQKVLAKKVRFWRTACIGMEIGAKWQGADMPPDVLLRELLNKHTNLVTRALVKCLIGTASLLWAFGYFS